MSFKIKPKTWTTHHTFRCLHLSGFFGFSIFCLIVASNLIGIANPGKADTQVSQTALITAQIGVINPGPNSGAGGIGGPQATPTVPPQTSVFARNIIGFEKISYNGQEITVPVVNPGFIELYGSSNLPMGSITIIIPTKPQLASGVNIGSDGNWNWKSPQSIPEGYYIIAVKISDPDVAEISNTQQFFLKVGSEVIPTPPPPDKEAPLPAAPEGTPTTPGAYQGGGNGGSSTPIPIAKPEPSIEVPSFVLQVLPDFKKIPQGSRFAVKISSGDFAGLSKEKSLGVTFKITDNTGKIILEIEDNVAFTKNIEYTKLFYTDSRLTPGTYTVSATAHYLTFTLSSADELEITPHAVVAVSSQGTINYSSLVVTLSLVLLSAFIVGYSELVRITRLTRIIQKVDEQTLNKNSIL